MFQLLDTDPDGAHLRLMNAEAGSETDSLGFSPPEEFGVDAGGDEGADWFISSGPFLPVSHAAPCPFRRGDAVSLAGTITFNNGPSNQSDVSHHSADN